MLGILNFIYFNASLTNTVSQLSGFAQEFAVK
jgi:hypothetical protein